MSLGKRVRGYLGPFEMTAIDLYRGYFVDVDELVRNIASLGPFKRVLEVGAGDGLVSAGLRDLLPDAHVLGIDIGSHAGRMVSDLDRLEFRQIATSELLLEERQAFDLVLIADVLHHVPASERAALLRDAVDLLAPTGVLVVKDWERKRGVPHYVTYAADRYLSGDRGVSFMTLDELHHLLAANTAGLSVVAEFRVPPHANNVLVALRRD